MLAILVDEKDEYIKQLAPVKVPERWKERDVIWFVILPDLDLDLTCLYEDGDARAETVVYDEIAVETGYVIIRGVRHKCLKFNNETQHKIILKSFGDG